MARRFRGNSPDEKNYKLIGLFDGFNVWMFREHHGNEIPFKLASIKRRYRKANYWILFNPATGDLRGRDAYTMKENNEDMATRLSDWLGSAL